MTMPHYPGQPQQPIRPPQVFGTPGTPVPPPPSPTMPFLHLVGAGLIALGLLFVYFGFRTTMASIGSLRPENSGEVLSVLGGIMAIAGIIIGGIARFIDSKAITRR